MKSEQEIYSFNITFEFINILLIFFHNLYNLKSSVGQNVRSALYWYGV